MSLRVNQDRQTGEYESAGLLFEFSFTTEIEREQIATDRGLLVSESGFNWVTIERVTNPNGDEVGGGFELIRIKIESLIN